MADKKITQLTNITGADLASADEFVVVDITADETKAITFDELKTAFDTSTGFVRITGDTMTGALDVQETITSDGLTNNGDVVFSKSTTGVPILKMSGFATSSNPYGIINFYNEDGSQQGPNNAVQIKALAKNSDGSGGELSFHTSTGTGSEGADAVERLRIDSSGNLLVGTTSFNNLIN